MMQVVGDVASNLYFFIYKKYQSIIVEFPTVIAEFPNGRSLVDRALGTEGTTLGNRGNKPWATIARSVGTECPFISNNLGTTISYI